LQSINNGATGGYNIVPVKGILQLYQTCISFYFLTRELENRLQKQKATQRYIEEFKTKRDEVCYLTYLAYN